MRPEDTQQKPRSIDGVSLPPAVPGAQNQPRQPEYRYDHELPAPKPHELLGEHALQETVVMPSVNPADSQSQSPLPAGGEEKPKKKKSFIKKLCIGLVILLVLVIAAVASLYVWYQQQLQPVDAASTDRVRLVIESGSTQRTIASQLKQEGLIKSRSAFIAYTEISGTKSQLKAGAYNLQKSESVPQIVDHLVSGKVDEFSITFLPGDTLANHRKRIIAAGYSAADVDAALQKQYDHPALVSKPASADLEGYIYGETYRFASSATPEDIIVRTLDELQKEIVAENLTAKLKAQNMNLFQGITLASIVQREVSSAADSAQVAQVFYSRIKQGMNLGSDVTYHYAADKMNVARDFNLDSPYNTRKYKGLPPGPIASPGLGALKAVANPAAGDFLYFVSGDDDKTYFARTNAEHEANVAKHCLEKCLLP